MVEAKPKSYKERMRAARAAARAKRQAEKAEWLRQVTLVAEVRRLSLEAVKATIRDRGDKVTLYTHAQLRAQADALIGPWLVAQARARVEARLNETCELRAIQKPRFASTSSERNSCSEWGGEMIKGYARVSTDGQDLATQYELLREAGATTAQRWRDAWAPWSPAIRL